MSLCCTCRHSGGWRGEHSQPCCSCVTLAPRPHSPTGCRGSWHVLQPGVTSTLGLFSSRPGTMEQCKEILSLQAVPAGAPDGALIVTAMPSWVPICWLVSRSCLGPQTRPEGLLQNVPRSGTGTTATVPSLHPQRGLFLGNHVLWKLKIMCRHLGFFFFPQFKGAGFVPLFCIERNKTSQIVLAVLCLCPLHLTAQWTGEVFQNLSAVRFVPC